MISVLPYDPVWAQRFEDERQLLRRAFRDGLRADAQLLAEYQ